MQRGMTLIELIVALVVMAIVSLGAIALMNRFTLNQAEQADVAAAVQLADMFVAEIAMADYQSDSQAVERQSFTSLDDYDNLANNGCNSPSSTPCNRQGQPLPAYAGFHVGITVHSQNEGGLPAKLAVVTITTPQQSRVILDYLVFGPQS